MNRLMIKIYINKSKRNLGSCRNMMQRDEYYLRNRASYMYIDIVRRIINRIKDLRKV